MPSNSMSREIAAVRQSLRSLEKALARLERRTRAAGEASAARPGKETPKLNLSPARRKALQLHGRYLGYIRGLKPKAKAEVRALRGKKGVRAAIARARKLTGA